MTVAVHVINFEGYLRIFERVPTVSFNFYLSLKLTFERVKKMKMKKKITKIYIVILNLLHVDCATIIVT